MIQVVITAILLGIPTLPEYQTAVQMEVMEIILDVSSGYECGRRCEREGWEDQSDYVITESEARELARVFTYHADDRVELSWIVGIAWQEAGFHRYAMGYSGECGMFQQMPQYMPPNIHSRFSDDEDRCASLRSPVQAAETFVTQTRRLQRRFGRSWPCHYNAGGICTPRGQNYEDEFWRKVERVERRLDRVRVAMID